MTTSTHTRWPLVQALVIGIMLTGAVAAPAVTGASAPSAHQVVESSADRLMAVVTEGRSYYEAEPERFYQAVHDALEPVVDFDRIAKSVMGREHFRAATPEQLTRFSEVFRWGLVRAYASALLDFGEDRMEVVPSPRPPEYENRRHVNMKIRADNGKVYQVMYSMTRDGDGQWRMANLTIEGLNLGQAYRNQFQRAMEELKDIDRVIETWTERITNEKIEIGSE